MRSTIAWRLGVTAAWASVFALAFVTTTPKPWLLTSVGIGLGGISGYLLVASMFALLAGYCR